MLSQNLSIVFACVEITMRPSLTAPKSHNQAPPPSTAPPPPAAPPPSAAAPPPSAAPSERAAKLPALTAPCSSLGIRSPAASTSSGVKLNSGGGVADVPPVAMRKLGSAVHARWHNGLVAKCLDSVENVQGQQQAVTVVLVRTAQLIEERMRAGLQRLEPRVRSVAEHF